ncbi:MAG: type I pullulanase, partial [Prevotella sp.]|nr:type I pullulanase [Prevotella sp.]
MKSLIIAGILSLLSPRTVAAQTFQEVGYTPEMTVFSLFAPNDAKRVTVRLYRDGQGGKAYKTIKMTRTAPERWQTSVKGDLMGQFYTFDVGRGECPGVFAKAVGVNGKRGAIIDMTKTNPTGWENDRRPVMKSPVDLVVYEMHHRDFSIARPEAKYPGIFMALTEPWAID